jgi:hypothetical protein
MTFGQWLGQFFTVELYARAGRGPFYGTISSIFVGANGCYWLAHGSAWSLVAFLICAACLVSGPFYERIKS